jgi:hypothetical protein
MVQNTRRQEKPSRITRSLAVLTLAGGDLNEEESIRSPSTPLLLYSNTPLFKARTSRSATCRRRGLDSRF